MYWVPQSYSYNPNPYIPYPNPYIPYPNLPENHYRQTLAITPEDARDTPMFIYIWAFFKNASLPWSLNTGEQVLRQLGFEILDGAANGNVHVMGRRRNPEVIADVVCTRLGQNPTSVVIHAYSPDDNAARTAAEQVRDHIKRAHSLEGDVVLNPVKE